MAIHLFLIWDRSATKPTTNNLIQENRIKTKLCLLPLSVLDSHRKRKWKAALSFPIVSPPAKKNENKKKIKEVSRISLLGKPLPLFI